MNDFLAQFTYFGMALSIFAYFIGFYIQKKFRHPLLNPLLIAIILVCGILVLFQINYETYNKTASYITYFLTPATVCLAVPLYRQVEILKRNFVAILAGIFCGCIAHLAVIAGLGYLLHVDKVLILSLLSKSVTTPIALGITGEIGGIGSVTVLGVMIAGLMGAVLGPKILGLFHVKLPTSQGLALGTASHAVGTSKAIELGEIQAAMSSLAIVVTGILTVILVPIYLQLIS
jgi:predicted murein hydrolase (TIGR00659 family)